RSTNKLKPGSQVAAYAEASAGSGGNLTTHVSVSQGNFVDSLALATGVFEITNTGLLPGDCLNLEVIKTNGAHVTVSVTNNDLGGLAFTLARNLADQVNREPLLMNLDGVSAAVASSSNAPGVALALSLQARTAGVGPSQIKATLTSSSPDFWLPPAT